MLHLPEKKTKKNGQNVPIPVLIEHFQPHHHRRPVTVPKFRHPPEDQKGELENAPIHLRLGSLQTLKFRSIKSQLHFLPQKKSVR